MAQRRLLAALLVVDLIFITVHAGLRFARDWGYAVDRQVFDLLSISTDNALPEMFIYAQLAVGTVLLTSAAVRTGGAVFLVLGAAYAYALLDDALSIHERVAHATVGARASGAPGVDLSDVVELLALGLPAAGFIVLFAFWYLSCPLRWRPSALLCLAAFVALGGFAAGADFLHQVVGGMNLRLSQMLTLIEDGGEMVAVTAMTWAAMRVRAETTWRHPVRRPVPGGAVA